MIHHPVAVIPNSTTELWEGFVGMGTTARYWVTGGLTGSTGYGRVREVKGWMGKFKLSLSHLHSGHTWVAA